MKVSSRSIVRTTCSLFITQLPWPVGPVNVGNKIIILQNRKKLIIASYTSGYVYTTYSSLTVIVELVDCAMNIITKKCEMC